VSREHSPITKRRLADGDPSSIAIEKLQAVRVIVSHAECPDGIASAMILRDVLPAAEVVMIHHGSEGHRDLLAVPGMLFCDMSPPRARVQEFVDAGAIVLDHHRTARDIVEAFGEHGVFADEMQYPGVSGALIAFTYVWRPLAWRADDVMIAQVREFARIVGVRDTWQRDSPDWRRACEQAEMLLFFPDWLILPTFTREAGNISRMTVGRYLVAKHEVRVKQKVERAYRFTSSHGTRVLVFEGLSYASDAAELVGQDADLVVGFSFDSRGTDQVLNFSTRSHTSFDCAAFCAANGGGGHKFAAGFDVIFMPETASNPFAILRILLDDWEF